MMNFYTSFVGLDDQWEEKCSPLSTEDCHLAWEDDREGLEEEKHDWGNFGELTRELANVKDFNVEDGKLSDQDTILGVANRMIRQDHVETTQDHVETMQSSPFEVNCPQQIQWSEQVQSTNPVCREASHSDSNPSELLQNDVCHSDEAKFCNIPSCHNWGRYLESSEWENGGKASECPGCKLPCLLHCSCGKPIRPKNFKEHITKHCTSTSKGGKRNLPELLAFLEQHREYFVGYEKRVRENMAKKINLPHLKRLKIHSLNQDQQTIPCKLSGKKRKISSPVPTKARRKLISSQISIAY